MSTRRRRRKPSPPPAAFRRSGTRSVAGAGPLQGYRATPLAEVNSQGNAATLCIAMLETPEGIANADAIAAVPGIDVLLIGSNDLCTAMGIPGELKHPKLRAAYETTAKACKAHSKHLGVGGIRGDVEHVAELVKLGARFVIAASDVQYLMMAARNEVAALRKATGDLSYRLVAGGESPLSARKAPLRQDILPHFQKSRPSSRMKRASTILCTSEAPSTSRAERA